jgi:CRP/FNR family transcriptional regulator, cyclic AMP receptor protein
MKHSLLNELKPHHLDELLKNAEEVQFASGQVIFREGDPANRFYLIQSGRVVVESPMRRGAPIQIEALGAGEALGWSWLFPGFVWRFQARALETTRAIACDGGHLLVHSEKDNFGYESIKRVVQALVRRLQATRKLFAQIGQS